MTSVSIPADSYQILKGGSVEEVLEAGTLLPNNVTSGDDGPGVSMEYIFDGGPGETHYFGIRAVYEGSEVSLAFRINMGLN